MEPLCTLDDWLAHVEKLHEKPIDLGLDRMKLMIERMGIRFECPVVTVAGTNGKGSTCAMIERICRAAGLRTGMHTSPHLIRFNERALLCGREASDEALVECLKEVEDARRGLSLSYFEFTGLAILRLFQKSALDVVVLEIGLGGRLDAINAVDPDVSVICAVGIDHTAFLGSTREAIGLEKAHIYRSGRPAICADPEPPVTIPEYAREIGAHYLAAGRDFDVKAHADGTFDFIFGEERIEGLPRPALVGRNQHFDYIRGNYSAFRRVSGNFIQFPARPARVLVAVVAQQRHGGRLDAQADTGGIAVQIVLALLRVEGNAVYDRGVLLHAVENALFVAQYKRIFPHGIFAVTYKRLFLVFRKFARSARDHHELPFARERRHCGGKNNIANVGIVKGVHPQIPVFRRNG